jgi:hypothetical protein
VRPVRPCPFKDQAGILDGRWPQKGRAILMTPDLQDKLGDRIFSDGRVDQPRSSDAVI